MLKHSLIVLACFGLLCFVLIGQTASPVEAGSLQNDLNAAIAAGKLGSSARISVAVYDLDSKSLVYTQGADLALIPASNQKLLTSAAALCELGEDFELSTRVLYRGTLKSGALAGDLLVLGRGDPDISARFHDDPMQILRLLARELRNMGITRVDGDLCVDESYFSGPRVHESWPTDQYLRWYCAEVSALPLNDNCVTIEVAPSRVGAQARVRIVPATSYVSLSGAVQTTGGKSDPKVGWSRPRESNELKVWGTVSAQRGAYTGDCTVSDPAMFFATVMREALAQEGVHVAGSLKRIQSGAASGWVPVARHGIDVASACFVCNSESQNLYAENLFRVLGAESIGEGSFSGGSRAIARFLRSCAIASDGLVVADGSGLSRDNRVSARTLASLLRAMADRREYRTFRSTLAVAGESGTLERRLGARSTDGRVWAKTGTIDGVSSLSGYVDARSGKRYAFSILINGGGGSRRRSIDRFVETLAGS